MKRAVQVQILAVSLGLGIGIGFIFTYFAGLATGIAAASFVVGGALLFVGTFSDR